MLIVLFTRKTLLNLLHGELSTAFYSPLVCFELDRSLHFLRLCIDFPVFSKRSRSTVSYKCPLTLTYLLWNRARVQYEFFGKASALERRDGGGQWESERVKLKRGLTFSVSQSSFSRVSVGCNSKIPGMKAWVGDRLRGQTNRVLKVRADGRSFSLSPYHRSIASEIASKERNNQSIRSACGRL